VMTLVGTNAAFDGQANETRLMERFRTARHALTAALQEHIERRRHASGADDMLALLLAARNGPGGQVSDDEICDQLLTMGLAGHETTASSITWALVCLQEEPGALQRLVHEIDEAGADLPDERLAGLPYLQAVCLETLRMRPVIPVVSRELQRPFRLRE